MTALELELLEALRDYVIGDKVRGITASATHLKACAAIQRAESAVGEPVIDDLSMMVRRLVLVARRHVEDDHKDLTFANDCLKWLQTKGLTGSPLRDTTPPAAVPLSDEQIRSIHETVHPNRAVMPYGAFSFARAIEAAHGITGEKQ